MKKILIVLLCLWTVAKAQTVVPGYQFSNNGLGTLRFYTNALNIPAMGTPALATGQWVKAGALVYDSTGGNAGLHVWNGAAFIRIIDTTFGLRAVDTVGHWMYGFGKNATADSFVYFIGSTRYAVKDSGSSASSTDTSLLIHKADSATISNPKGFVKGKDIIGDIVRTTFPGSSVPSNFTQGAGGATITYSDGVTITGGNGNYSGDFVKSTYVSQSNNYVDTFEFTINTKPANSSEGLWMGKISTINNMYVTLRNVSTDSMHAVMRVVNGSGNGTPFDSTTNISMANGGTYRVIIVQTTSSIYWRLSRIVTGKETEFKEKIFVIPIATYNQLPSVGSIGIGVLGADSYTVTKLVQTDYDFSTTDIAFIGTSILQAYAPTSFENLWVHKLMSGTGLTYSNFGASGGGFSDGINALPEVYNSHCGRIVVEYGINDAAANLRLYASAFFDTLAAHGYSGASCDGCTDSKVLWVQDFTASNKDSIIFNIAKERRIQLVRPGLTMDASYFDEGTHPNDKGSIYMAQFIKSAAPNFFRVMGRIDQSSFRGSKDVVFSGLATGDVPVYSSTTGKWANTAQSSLGFIQNQQAAPQTANGYITGNFSTSAGFIGVGTQATSSAQIQTEEAASNGNGILIRNTSAASSATKVLQLVVKGGSAAEGSDWNNAGVVEAVPNGGLVFDAYTASAGIKFQLNRVTKGVWNSSGFGVGTSTPTQQLTVNGQIRINAITASSSTSDSNIVINGGSLKALASADSTYLPTLTNVTNVASSSVSGGSLHYIRRGSQVSISGIITVTPTAGTTLTQVAFSIPVSSNFAASTDAAGVCTAIGSTYNAGIASGDITNDRVQLDFLSSNTSAHSVSFNVTYTVK